MFPHYVQKSKEQHYFGNGVRGHVRYAHDMLCASLLGATGHVCTAKCQNSNRPSLHDICTCKHETSGALHCLSILQTVVTRLQTPYQRPQSPSGPRLIPSPIHGSDLGSYKYFKTYVSVTPFQAR
eukprot:1146701-Pelagomonas_calceolata.AAC.1